MPRHPVAADSITLDVITWLQWSCILYGAGSKATWEVEIAYNKITPEMPLSCP